MSRSRDRTNSLYALAAAVLVALAATVKTDGYVSNILMQAATYAIAVFGLSIVLGLCCQINLAQAAFFALGAYTVALGTVDYNIPFWLCLVGGMTLALAAGAGLGLSTLRLGGHYLAMVTISFQQILTVVLINAIGFTHGPDGVSSIPRPTGFTSGQSFLALVVAILAISGYFVWRLADTRLGAHARGPRQRARRERQRNRHFPHETHRLRARCFARGAGWGLFAGGFSYISPDQFAFADSIVLLTMALLGGALADWLGYRHGSAHPDPRMAHSSRACRAFISRCMAPPSSSLSSSCPTASGATSTSFSEAGATAPRRNPLNRSRCARLD